ncbi:MAG: prepilin-type cleavage/methylation domain-containing protein [Nitrosomonadales bacterium]|nr:prepilin-type cleavage/methylation domain-containing protein [Nitrosomonadales bacterium]
MRKQKSSPQKFSQQGIVLLEALIAILIFSMGVLALVGLQAAMIRNTASSKFRADASYIAQQRIGMMWADPGNLANYLEVNTDISTLLPQGTRSVDQPVPGLLVVTVTWQEPGQPQHNFTATASIFGG